MTKRKENNVVSIHGNLKSISITVGADEDWIDYATKCDDLFLSNYCGTGSTAPAPCAPRPKAVQLWGVGWYTDRNETDATSYDVVIQTALFGEVKYG